MKMKPFKRDVLKRHIGVHKKELFIFIFEEKGKVLRGSKFWGRLWDGQGTKPVSQPLGSAESALSHSTLQTSALLLVIVAVRPSSANECLSLSHLLTVSVCVLVGNVVCRDPVVGNRGRRGLRWALLPALLVVSVSAQQASNKGGALRGWGVCNPRVLKST